MATLSLLFFESTHTSAQSLTTYTNDTLKETIHISFPLGSYSILPDYEQNKVELGKIDALWGRLTSDSTLSLQRLVIVGVASPDGLYDRNKYLARMRTEELKKYISSIKGISPGRIVTRYVDEDWNGVALFAERATTAQLPHREKILEVARSTMAPDEKERILRSECPNDFQYLLVHCMPTLRRTDWSLEYQLTSTSKRQDINVPSGTSAKTEAGTRTEGGTGELANNESNQPMDAEVCKPTERETSEFADNEVNQPTDSVANDTAVTEESTELEAESSSADAKQKDNPFHWMVKTNLLYDAVAIPNVGVELPLGHRWSVAGEWMYAWWKSDRRHRYWQGYGGYLSVRKYFGKTADDHPYTGHHVGAYGTTATYDFEWGGRGYQAARFGFGGGLEYGYSMALARRLNLDFALGLGFQDGKYKVYDPIDSHYVWQSTHKRHWWGPTKADISLVWLLGRDNVHKKKGGQL